jgi:hypothetical protein
MPKTTKRRVSPGACHPRRGLSPASSSRSFASSRPFRSKFMNYVNRDEEICLNVNISM